MTNEHIIISLKRFLLIEQCPTAWKGLDLYLFRDEQVVFYVGQSHLAFARVWEHLLSGFKGHSIVGRFIWCNWPQSMNFTIELLSSKSESFKDVTNELNACERSLIQKYSPCFNVSLNQQPNQPHYQVHIYQPMRHSGADEVLTPYFTKQSEPSKPKIQNFG